jgi:FkbM family methyltransferase
MTPKEAPWRALAAGAIIITSRKLFANTPVQRLPLTSKIYARVFRFGNESEEVTIDFRGVQLTVPTKDITIVPGLVGGFYESLELDVFERLAVFSETIIDVGANIGAYSCIAANRAPSHCDIVAFEPVSENLRYLRRNLEGLSQGARVQIEEKAVGQTGGTIKIYLDEGSIGTHSPSASNAPNSTTSTTVPVVALDEYVQQKFGGRPVDLLKVDVEGYEGAVLRGARRTLRESKPTLFIEFVPAHLVNCDFRPDEFLNIIFGIYSEVYLVDEPRATFEPCSKDDVLGFSVRGHKNANLIATSEADRPAHHHVIESIRGALSPATRNSPATRHRRPFSGR